MIGDLVAIYRACFHASVAMQLQYRLSLVIWLLGLVIQPLIYLVVWRTVAGTGSVGGYSAGDFAAYYLVLIIVNHVTFTWVMFEFDFEIRQGTLSAKLLKPTNPIHMHLADNVAYKLLTMVIVLPTSAALALHFRPTLAPTLGQAALFVVALALAFALRWIVEYTIALSAFWTTRINSVSNVYGAVFWFMAGLIAPTATMPPLLQQVAAILPFRSMVAFPIELLLGRQSGPDIVVGLATQLVWIGLALGVNAGVWRVGLRRYAAVGA